MNSPDHHKIIREQFTKQTVPFAQLKGHFDSVSMLVELAQPSNEDTVLDVGCGPGIVACEFARISNHVVGFDLTDSMLEAARRRQVEEGLVNLEWKLGSATELAYEDHTFSLVISRYTFHHFIDPEIVLSEMVRVCRPGGRVLVADPVLPPEFTEAYNQMERLRDPSHVRALSVKEFDRMFVESGLIDIQRAGYPVDMELEQQLAASFPEPGNDEILRRLFREDVQTQQLGTNTRLVNGQIYFTYPISIYVGTKPQPGL